MQRKDHALFESNSNFMVHCYVLITLYLQQILVRLGLWVAHACVCVGPEGVGVGGWDTRRLTQ